MRPSTNSIFNVSRSVGSNYLTKLRFGSSHLRRHKFRHNFLDLLKPICHCGKDNETAKHFLPPQRNFTHERQTLLQNVKEIDSYSLSLNVNSLPQTLNETRIFSCTFLCPVHDHKTSIFN